jgi:hypothetical protein
MFKGACTPSESSRVQSSQTHKDAAMTILFAYNSRRTSAYTPADSSQVESRESCRVKSLDAARSIFASQTLVIVRGGCCLQEDMDLEKLIFLVKNNVAIYSASHYEHRNRDCIASV